MNATCAREGNGAVSQFFLPLFTSWDENSKRTPVISVFFFLILWFVEFNFNNS